VGLTPDAGDRAASLKLRAPDAGIPEHNPTMAGGIRWPDEVRPLATLDGPAVLAANAAMQAVLARLAKENKEYAGHCDFSAKAMEVVVGEGAGMYIVRVNQRVDKCGWAAPGFETETDWLELYAVSPEGKILARYPYHP
jgi:hypothetical protein